MLVPGAAVAAPILASAIGRWVTVPLVVFEILLGILIGPQVAGWVRPGPILEFLADLGLAMLFLLAGYEVDFARIRGRPLRLSAIGWLISLAAGIVLSLLFAHNAPEAVIVGICLTSTTLGTLMPILRDAGELESRFGAAMLAIGAAGEFGPLIAVALFLSGRSELRAALILVVFACLIALSLLVTMRYEHWRVDQLIAASMHSSGQFGIRLVMLVLAVLVGLAVLFGLDMLLGAFAAGILISLLLRDVEPGSRTLINEKLDAVGFGFLVPIFFVKTGVTFDARALFGSAATLALVPVFLVLFLVLRGVPATLSAPLGSSWTDRLAIVLFGATGLPIIVAVTAIGVDHGELGSSTAAALIGAGMISVLIFPLVGLRVRRRSRDQKPRAAD
jgi:Kef-type K+ transport system membrane component KefB